MSASDVSPSTPTFHDRLSRLTFDHYRVYSTSYDGSRGVCTAHWVLEGSTASDGFLVGNPGFEANTVGWAGSPTGIAAARVAGKLLQRRPGP